MAVELTDDQIDLLNQKVLAHVATVMPDGSPHVTPVWIDTDGTVILFNTAKGRVKHRNIERNPNVAISIVDMNDDDRILVVFGRAEFIDEGADAHIDKLSKKYLNADSYPDRRANQQRVIVRVVPERIHVKT